MQHGGGRGDGGRGEDGTAGFGGRPRADASAVRLQPEDLLQTGLGRLPLCSTPVLRTQHLTCVLVHVVCVARRLRGCEESERVGRHGGGGEGLDLRVRGVRHDAVGVSGGSEVRWR